MLEKILLEICQEMSEVLEDGQLSKLKNLLFISFRGKSIADEKCEIVQAETDEDVRLLKIFRASKLIAGRSAGTLEQYIAELRNCRAVIGKGFKDITTMDLRWYLGVLKEKRKNKLSTIQNKIRYLNSFYEFLLREGIVNNNPVSRIETPKTEQVVRKPYTVEDMEAIRRCCNHIRDRALVEFMYATGLRVSEVSSLNIGDIDIQKKEFTVVGKGNKERTVYFSPTAYFYLKDYFRWLQKINKEPIENLKDRPLFVSIKGDHKRMMKPGIEALCRKIGIKAKVDNVHPHRFRRTFATNMVNRGMRLEELMKIMGHSKMDTTLIYCSIGQDNIKNSYAKCCA